EGLLPVPGRRPRGRPPARGTGSDRVSLRARRLGPAHDGGGRRALRARAPTRVRARRLARRLRPPRGARRALGRAPHVRGRSRPRADAPRPRGRAARARHGRPRPRRGVRRALRRIRERPARDVVRGGRTPVSRRAWLALTLAFLLGATLRIVHLTAWPP